MDPLLNQLNCLCYKALLTEKQGLTSTELTLLSTQSSAIIPRDWGQWDMSEKTSTQLLVLSDDVGKCITKLFTFHKPFI